MRLKEKISKLLNKLNLIIRQSALTSLNKNILLITTSLFSSISVIAQNENKNSPPPPPPPPLVGKVEQIFIRVPDMPRFPGCEGFTGSDTEKDECANEKMMAFLYENLEYPNEAREKGITGSVIASFIVEPNGYISNTKIEKGLIKACDEQVLRAIKLMCRPGMRWSPGRSRGRPVRVLVKVKLEFSEKMMNSVN